MQESHQNILKIVLPLIDRIMTAEWSSAAKGSCPISWLTSRVSRCSLLMPREALKNIVACGHDWKNQAEGDMGRCIDSGCQLAERLFSSCLRAMVAAKVAEAMQAGVVSLCALKPPPAAPGTAAFVTQEMIHTCRADLLTKCSAIQGALKTKSTKNTTNNTEFCFVYYLCSIICFFGA